MLVDGRRVVLNVVSEKESALSDEIMKPASARLQQLEHRKEPRVTGAEIAVVPDSSLLQKWLESSAQLVGRQPRDVLLVEPIELLLIEDRVAAADAFEPERRRQLVAREYLLIGARRPSKQRQEIHHR